MSDPHSHNDDSPHEGPIKTPKQLILAVVFSFVVPVIAIVLLATFVTSDQRPSAAACQICSPSKHCNAWIPHSTPEPRLSTIATSASKPLQFRHATVTSKHNWTVYL